MMNEVEHLIIGGGISGCAMARQLSKRQLDFKLIEAQASLGGRIQSTEQYIPYLLRKAEHIEDYLQS